MKMNKNTMCNLVRSYYPKAFGIRLQLQRLKVKRLRTHTLTDQEIAICEADPTKKEEIIQPYLQKWKRWLFPSVKEMEDILENAPQYRERVDKKNLRADMMFCRLAYGFLPSEYIVFDLEEKTPEERKTFISDTDSKEFGYSVNDITTMQRIIDKAQSYENYSKYFKRDAVVVEKKTDYDKYCTFISKHPVFVKKVALSSMGKGIELVDLREQRLSEEEYFVRLISTGKYLLEERVIQVPEMARFNPSSVNTIRCITLKTDRGVEIPWCFMRTGRNGAFVDNGGSGGLIIGVDADSGAVFSDGIDEYNNVYKVHPDTKVSFIGSVVPQWEDMIAFCKKAAAEFNDVRYLSWDMALTENGWIVIEINEVGQMIGPQMTRKRGLKAELAEYFARMDKVV